MAKDLINEHVRGIESRPLRNLVRITIGIALFILGAFLSPYFGELGRRMAGSPSPNISISAVYVQPLNPENDANTLNGVIPFGEKLYPFFHNVVFSHWIGGIKSRWASDYRLVRATIINHSETSTSLHNWTVNITQIVGNFQDDYEPIAAVYILEDGYAVPSPVVNIAPNETKQIDLIVCMDSPSPSEHDGLHNIFAEYMDIFMSGTTGLTAYITTTNPSIGLIPIEVDDAKRMNLQASDVISWGINDTNLFLVPYRHFYKDPQRIKPAELFFTSHDNKGIEHISNTVIIMPDEI